MPFDSNGVFSRVMNWTSDQQNGIAIECGRHDAEDNNFAEGFNETFCRDGRAAATGNFNLGNHKIQNLADGIAATDAVTKGQLDASSAAGVSLNTAQTITGSKTFLGGYQNVKLKVNSSAADAYTDLTFLNYDSSLSGYIRAFNNGDISFITSQNIKLSHAPTDDNTTSTQVDTVGARNTKLSAGLATKQDTITGAATSITSSDLTASRVLISNSSGKVAASSSVTTTELGYLDGVTSAIQTQINAKAADNAVVKITGNQTIDGIKTFSDSVITEISMARGTGHANDIYGGYGIHDSNGNLFASLIAKSTAGSGENNSTPGNSSVFLRVYNPNNTSSSDAKYLQLIYGTDGSSYATCPASDKNGSIVTTVNKSKAANGYFELGNGLIMQWGTSNGSGSQTVTFPKAFTSTNYTIVGISKGESYCVVGTKTKSNVSVGNSVGFDWLAIGY